MSTTFGIKNLATHEPEFIEIAHRHGCGNGKVCINILNPLALMLPDDTVVHALDNSNQGIYTIGDIKDKLEEQKSS